LRLMKLKLSNDMKTYLECIHQAALDMKATDHYNSYYAVINYIAPILNRAADMYAEQSNSHKPVVVRGGAIEAQSVPLEGDALKWTNSCVTQNTPTEPLATEARDTVAEAVDIYRSREDMMLEISRLRRERDYYKDARKSSEGQP